MKFEKGILRVYRSKIITQLLIVPRNIWNNWDEKGVEELKILKLLYSEKNEDNVRNSDKSDGSRYIITFLAKNVEIKEGLLLYEDLQGGDTNNLDMIPLHTIEEFILYLDGIH